jgi:hypothetical protein
LNSHNFFLLENNTNPRFPTSVPILVRLSKELLRGWTTYRYSFVTVE